MEMVNSLKRYIKAIVPHIVYKSAREAEKYETLETRKAGDEYVGAMLLTDDLFITRGEALSAELLHKVGIYDEQKIAAIQADSAPISEELRQRLIKLRRKEIVDKYEEKNNYYRMLAGLPDIDADFVYLDPRELQGFGFTHDSVDDYDNDRLDKLTPIHRLPQSVLNAMESTGYLEEVYKAYSPDDTYNAEYIRHLGLRRVDIVQARMAGHYELLYVPRPLNANRFNRDFIFYYEEARQYFLNQVYNFHYSSRFNYYEGYIGFFIMVMALQRMVDSMFEVMVDRDFYDVETCRMFLEAYGVPFVEEFTFRQQKTLVKNLNILIMNKCTSQVLYDILSLLEYDKYDLTKYLLVKQHKMAQYTEDDEPKPIFIYRSVLDEYGNASYELDKTKSYDYYFVGVPMDETDIKLVEQTDADAHDYDKVTVPDELWIEDEELVEKLQEAEINYVETKYTNIAITLRMQEILFEHIYLQKMLCDKSYETSRIMVDLALISATPVSLFEVEIILICITCKYNRMSPDLISTPSKALAVLGFNFDADLEAIKEEITSNPRIYSQSVIKFIENIQFHTVEDVNAMYANVKALAKMLTEIMQNTQSPIVYHAHKKLYTALLVTDVHNEVFNLPDGSTPETYMDWLKAYDPAVYDYIDKLEPEECVDKINYIATKMSTWFEDTDYLHYLEPIDMTIIRGIIKILRWFKSYTIEIKEMEVVYLFDSRYYNAMKMMSRLWFHANMTIRETDMGYHDWLQSCSAVMKVEETRNKFFEFLRASATMSLSELDNRMKDAIRLVAKLRLNDVIIGTYSDSIKIISRGRLDKEEHGEFVEHVRTESTIRTYDKNATLVDSIFYSEGGKMTIDEHMLYEYIDALVHACASITVKDRMVMTDTRRPLRFIIHDT